MNPLVNHINCLFQNNIFNINITDWKLFPTELQFGKENKKEKTSKTKLVVDIEEKLKNMEDKDEESEKEEDKEEGERDDQEENDENVEEDIEEVLIFFVEIFLIFKYF